MAHRCVIPRSSFALVLSALVIAAAISFNTLYTARGDSHYATYYACLFNGALSRVGATPPADCGRGTMISWDSSTDIGPAGVNTTNLRTGFVADDTLYADGATMTNPNPGEYIISYPAGTFPSINGLDTNNFPVVTALHATGRTPVTWNFVVWFSDGSLTVNLSTGGVNSFFHFVVTQYIPEDATFDAVSTSSVTSITVTNEP